MTEFDEDDGFRTGQDFGGGGILKMDSFLESVLDNITLFRFSGFVRPSSADSSSSVYLLGDLVK